MHEFFDCQINFQDEKDIDIEEEDQPMNRIPKNAIEWESTFDRQDRYKKKEMVKPTDFIEINIGTDKEPRNIKIGKGTSKKERKDLIDLVKEYKDVFAFTYGELKAYRDDVFQHTIPLRPEAKPFQQKLRRINPKLTPMVQKKLQKMLATSIIAPTRHSSWCSNLVVV